MKKIRNFNLSYVSRDAAQYDARLLDENDVVAARYRRYDGYENNPNICALPEEEDMQGLYRSHAVPLPGYDSRLVPQIGTEERQRILFGIKDVRLPLPFHASVESTLHNCLIRSYANREYRLAETGKTAEIVLDGHTVSTAMCSRRNDLMSTPPAFSVIGTAGSGKTSAIRLTLRKFPKVIIHELDEVSYIQIPIVLLTAPANSNLKALFIQFGQQMDDLLGQDSYYSEMFSKQTSNVGRASNMMTQIIKKFSIGMIIIDEIQQMDFKANSAKSFENFLAITSNSGVALCCIGTPDAMDKIAGDLRIYRRIAGITVKADEYCMEREYVKQLVSVLWQYQFTEIPVPFSDGTAELIADLSGGSIDAITTICFTIQRHAILRNCPEKMDCEYLRGLLTTRELEKMGAMIRVSRDKNLKGRLDYRTFIRGEGENSEYQKKEAELKGMLNAKSYGRVADMAAVRSSIMNVFDIYSEAMISAAYEEAEKEEGFAELPVSDKTKAVMGVLKKMRIPGRKKRAGKKEEKSPRPVLSDEELMEDMKKAAGGI